MAKEETSPETVTENEEEVTIQRSKEVELKDLEKEKDVYRDMKKKRGWGVAASISSLSFFL